MSIVPRRTLAPAEALLQVSDVKHHLTIGESDDDALLESAIAAVEARLDGYAGILGRALVEQTWQQDFPGFSPVLDLVLSPLIAVDQVAYFAPDGSSQVVPAENYIWFDAMPSPIVQCAPGVSWPACQVRPDAVRVTYRAGYGTAADVPDPIRQAAKMMVGSIYDTPEAHSTSRLYDLPVGARAFLFPYMRKGM